MFVCSTFMQMPMLQYEDMLNDVLLRLAKSKRAIITHNRISGLRARQNEAIFHVHYISQVKTLKCLESPDTAHKL